ncbi:MAG: hypothetical protein C0462_14405, partial [Alcanivorax sp.]|nr:hypothetical protein [Alcanivorax sp.]
WQDNEAWFADDFAGEYGSQLKVNFVGLFDSVPAIMGLLKDADPRLAAISPALLIARGDYSTANARNPGLAQYLPPDKVGKVVHLRARDEYREGFALNSVQPDHHEALLPGVHSDIGGGYLREQAEQHWLTRPRASSASFIASAESTPAYRQSQQDLEEWKRAHPHLADHPGLSIRVRTRSPRSGSAYWTGGQQRRVHTVATLNRVVRGELSLVYLHIMRELAAEQGVPLEPITPEDQALALPADLEAIYPKLLAQTQDGQDRLTDTEKQALYQRYVHVSAHWNRLTPALPLAVMKPADNYERIVHLHEAD